MHKKVLQRVYQGHHEERGRYGYLFCNGARAPHLKEWIGQGKRILDLGCRDGMLSQAFVEGNQVVGVDIDQKALELAEERLGIETVWLDLNQEWPFEPESFDVVVACEILEHLFFPDQVLSQIANCLKPGGLFIGSVPNAFRIRNRFRFLFGHSFDNDPTHVRFFSYGTLEAALNRFFFSLEILPLEGKVGPFWLVAPSTPLALSRLFAKDLLWCCQKR